MLSKLNVLGSTLSLSNYLPFKLNMLCVGRHLLKREFKPTREEKCQSND
jgi:hypothetical protein